MLPNGAPIPLYKQLIGLIFACHSGMFNAMRAASFRKGAGGDVTTSPVSSPQLGVSQSGRSLSRNSSRSSIGGESVEEKKKRHRFRRNKEATL